MDSLTFWAKIAEILGSFAWPAIVATALIIFAKEIRERISNIGELQYLGGKVVFNALEKASESAKKIQAEEVNGVQVSNPFAADESFVQLASLKPDAAISVAWKEVEEILRDCRSIMPGGWTRGGQTRGLVRKLVDLNYLTENAFELFLSLQEVRNVAVHGLFKSEITTVEALEFRGRIQVLINSLRRAVGRLKNSSNSNSQ